MELPDSYVRNQKLMQSGDLIEWHSKSTVGWMIRKFTGNDVNHTSLLIRPNDLLGYEDRRFLLEALKYGVTPTLLSERLKYFKGIVYWLPLKKRFDPIRADLTRFAVLKMCEDKSKDKGKYDYPSLLKQMLGAVSIDADRFFCSEWAQYNWTKHAIIPRQKKAVVPGGFEAFGATDPRVKIFDNIS